MMGMMKTNCLKEPDRIIRGAMLGMILLAITSCSSDGGTEPTGFGAVTGTVRTFSVSATSGLSQAIATVRVSGGGFDSTTSTDVNGIYIMGDVPARTVTVSASLSDCMAGSRSGVVVVKNDTITADVTLEFQADNDTIPLPGSGAVKMELVPDGHRAILLYDVSDDSPGAPSLVSVDLTTGASSRTEFTDLDQVFDMQLAGNNMVVFNYLGPAGFGLRFVNLNSMAATGGDVVYDTNVTSFAGHIALDNSGEHVFVAHALQPPYFVGKVYAVSVAERKLLDADNNPNDGNAAFDTLLVRRSLGWAYSIAYDDIHHEILVGNWNAGFITAIAWEKWGTFDRSAHLAVPTPGVRIVTVNAQENQFQPWFLGFASGVGITVWPQNSIAERFQSGAGASDLFYADPTVSIASTSHFLTVVPSRQSWFTICQDLTESDGDKRQTAVEERSWSTLHRMYRFESHHFTLPDRGFPRAFAADAVGRKLYVAYSNRPIIEVFCLP
jgi:hypothetical protein